VRQSGAEFVAFSPDGKRFATTNGTWLLPETAEQKSAADLAWPEKPWGLAFSSGGSRLAIRRTWQSKVEVWKLDGVLPERLDESSETPPGALLAVDDNGRYIVLQYGEGTALWDRQRGAERARIPVGASVAAFRGREAIVLAKEDLSGSLAVLAFAPMGPALAEIEPGPANRVLWLGVDGEHVRMLLASDKTMRVTSWNFSDGAVVSNFGVDISEPGKWAVSADGRRVVTGLPSGIVIGGDGIERQELATLATPDAVALSARGDVVAASVRNTVQAWNLDTGKHSTLPAEDSKLLDLRVSDDGQYVLGVAIVQPASRTGYAYQLIRWSLASATEPVMVPLGRNLGAPQLRCFVSSDGSRIVLSSGQQVDIATAAASPSARSDIRASCAPTIIGGTLQADIDGNSLVVTDTRLDLPIARLEHPRKIELAALSVDERYAVTSDEYGIVRIWAVDPGDLIAEACARHPHPLGPEDWSRYMPSGATIDACGRGRDHAEVTK
jgi:WD40 repeat protein